MSKILVVGSGSREHALGSGLARGGSGGHELLFAPGNAGTLALGRNVAVPASDVPALVELAEKERVDLVVVGPELPLTLGLVDALAEKGIAAFGPSRAAARLEGSKGVMKDICKRAGVPTAPYAVFDDAEAAKAYVRQAGRPLVVKADGLCAGKGVVVASSVEEACEAIDRMITQGELGDAGRVVVLEELLPGEEASFHVVCDGTRAIPLVAAQDHKRVFDGDRGPNTGGMGAYAPAPVVTPAIAAEVMTAIVEPTLRAMSEAGAPFRGVLFVGLMIDQGKPRVLEFNVRFGDPETTVLVPMLDGDWFAVLDGAARGDLSGVAAKTKSGAALAVVMASERYPASPATGDRIDGLEAPSPEGAYVYHAGTKRDGDAIVTAGGRVLTVGAQAASLAEARDLAYAAVSRIAGRGEHHRPPSGPRARGCAGRHDLLIGRTGVVDGRRARVLDVVLHRHGEQMDRAPSVVAGVRAAVGVAGRDPGIADEEEGVVRGRDVVVRRDRRRERELLHLGQRLIDEERRSGGARGIVDGAESDPEAVRAEHRLGGLVEHQHRRRARLEERRIRGDRLFERASAVVRVERAERHVDRLARRALRLEERRHVDHLDRQRGVGRDHGRNELDGARQERARGLLPVRAVAGRGPQLVEPGLAPAAGEREPAPPAPAARRGELSRAVVMAIERQPATGDQRSAFPVEGVARSRAHVTLIDDVHLPRRPIERSDPDDAPHLDTDDVGRRHQGDVGLRRKLRIVLEAEAKRRERGGVEDDDAARRADAGDRGGVRAEAGIGAASIPIAAGAAGRGFAHVAARDGRRDEERERGGSERCEASLHVPLSVEGSGSAPASSAPASAFAGSSTGTASRCTDWRGL